VKRFILILVAAMCLGSCAVKQSKNRTVTVYVPDGYELITASRNYWGVSYLVKPMADDYIPTTKKLLQENEDNLAWKTEVVFIESRGNMTSDQDCWCNDEDDSSWGLEDDVDYD
jgi:hypothetical protein